VCGVDDLTTGTYNGRPIFDSSFDVGVAKSHVLRRFGIELKLQRALVKRTGPAGEHYTLSYVGVCEGLVTHVVFETRNGKPKSFIIAECTSPIVYPVPSEAIFFFTKCEVCGKKPIYRVGRMGFCSEHRDLASKFRSASGQIYNLRAALKQQSFDAKEERKSRFLDKLRAAQKAHAQVS